jgi:hypothetical protein
LKEHDGDEVGGFTRHKGHRSYEERRIRLIFCCLNMDCIEVGRESCKRVTIISKVKQIAKPSWQCRDMNDLESNPTKDLRSRDARTMIVPLEPRSISSHKSGGEVLQQLSTYGALRPSFIQGFKLSASRIICYQYVPGSSPLRSYVHLPNFICLINKETYDG